MSDSNLESHEVRDGAARQPDGSPQDLRRELWLDLEDTVITPVVNGWHDFELINIEKVKDVISSFAPHAVHVFSFAVWDERQRQLFTHMCRPHLEKALGVKLQLVLTTDLDMIPIACRQLGMQASTVDFQEMSNFWGKQGTFRLCMRHHATNHRRHHPNLRLHVLLLDDVVYNETVWWPDLQTTVEQQNIDQL